MLTQLQKFKLEETKLPTLGIKPTSEIIMTVEMNQTTHKFHQISIYLKDNTIGSKFIIKMIMIKATSPSQLNLNHSTLLIMLLMLVHKLTKSEPLKKETMPQKFSP